MNCWARPTIAANWCAINRHAVLAAYLYAGAGPGESTTDVVFGGHSLIAENGSMLAETERFQFDTQIAIADIDLQRLTHERWTNSSFSAAGTRAKLCGEFISSLPQSRQSLNLRISDLLRSVPRTPFVPSDPDPDAPNIAAKSSTSKPLG